MPAPIIAAIDPYTRDRAPLDLALAAAEMTGAHVIAAAVHPWSLLDSPDLRDELRTYLGVDLRLLEDLSPPRALHLLAYDLDAGLIVVGSTDRGPADRVLTGTTAERLLHGSPCPVALAPRGYTAAPIDTIAVAFVDSPEGHAALTAGHLLAQRSGARLRVIAAVHPAGAFAAMRVPRPQRGALLEGRHRLETEAALERAIAGLAPGVAVESELHVEDPADVLLRITEHVDLLVCGSRGYGPMRSVLLGGVSHRIVRRARCPVLVLPRGVGQPLYDLVALAGASA